MFSDFEALKLMTTVCAQMRERAGKGIYKPGDAASMLYMKACRMIAPELGSSFLLVYEDLREPGLKVPDSCIYALHYGQQALPDAYVRDALAKLKPPRKPIDMPAKHQHLSMCRTIFGSFFDKAWAREGKDPKSNTRQFHAFLFMAPDLPSGRWRPVVPDREWPRAQGMRPLPEHFS